MKAFGKILFFNMTILVCGLGVIFGVFELYVRKTRPAIAPEFCNKDKTLSSPAAFSYFTTEGKRLVPGSRGWIKNHFVSRKNVFFRTNAHGFRGEDFPAAKPEKELRVIALGDSITVQDYLDEEQTWPRLLEKRLNKAQTAQKVRVVNAGIGGAGLREEAGLLAEAGLGIAPDWVVLGFYTNDSRPPWGFTSELDYPGWWRRHSRLVDTLCRNWTLRGWVKNKGTEMFKWVSTMERHNWRHERRAFLRLAADARHDWGAGWHRETWAGVTRQIDRVTFLARDHSFSLAVVLFPVFFQVYADFLENTPQRVMTEICRQRNIPVLDLLPLMRAHVGTRIFFDHCHPTETANRWISKAVFLLLCDNGIFPGAGHLTSVEPAGRYR